MRRYELMLVLRPDTADDRVQQILEKTTRGIAESGGQIVKVSPWGRRRLAYPISGHQEGSYFIVVFDAPGEAIDEVERSLNITEEVMRHLVTRVDRPTNARRSEGKGEGEDEDFEDVDIPDAYVEDDLFDLGVEVIDESEAEAAPKAIG